MAVSKVRSHYGNLSQIAQTFATEADNTKQSTSNIKNKMEQLRGGDWKGDAANKFYAEMDGKVLPALGRLSNALTNASEITKKISSLMKNAEQESSKVFMIVVEVKTSGGSSGASAGDAGAAAVSGAAGGAAGGFAGAAAGAAASGGGGGAPSSGGGGGSAPSSGGASAGAGSSGGGSAGGDSGAPSSGGGGGSSNSGGGGGGSGASSPGSAAAGGPSSSGAVSNNPLVSQAPSKVFSPANLANLASSNIQGAGSPDLRDAMKELNTNPPPTGEALDKILAKIAKARGKSLKDIKAQYEKFLKVKAQAAENAAAKGLPAPDPLSDSLNDNFLGSEQQLRSGELVGETFGIDPVFGALLNPGGGLAADGSVPVTQSAEGLNDAASDAATYLQNFHNVGPGPNYLGAGTDNLAFWQQKLVDTLSNA